MSRRVHACRASRGFTLVELLIAVAASTLVAAAALSVFLTITSSQRRQTESRRDEALQALEVLRRDIACALPTAYTNAPSFTLESSSGAPTGLTGEDHTDLKLTMGALDEDSTDLTRLRLWQVQYRRIPPGPGHATPVLRRDAVRLDAPGLGRSAETGILFRGAASFAISVFDGATWTNRWTPSSRRPLPKAVRMELGWTEAATTMTAEAWTVIPAAQAFPGPAQRGAPAGR